MPDYKGQIQRVWSSRTVPSVNGEKSLQEGQCIVVQTCTSQSLLAFNTVLVIAEIIGRRDQAIDILRGLGSLLPNAEEAVVDPKTTFEPVSDFGEKRVLPITNKTVVFVKKVEN